MLPAGSAAGGSMTLELSCNAEPCPCGAARPPLPTQDQQQARSAPASRASRSCGAKRKGNAEEQATADQMRTLGAARAGRPGGQLDQL